MRRERHVTPPAIKPWISPFWRVILHRDGLDTERFFQRFIKDYVLAKDDPEKPILGLWHHVYRGG